METKIIISGFGGQGVLSLGKMICLVADKAGKYVSFFPSYGGEQRGGTCRCTVVLSEKPIGSPIVTAANYVMIMNLPSYVKYKDSVLPGGLLMVNSSQVKEAETDGKSICIEVDRIADEAGNRIAANMVMLGAFTRKTGFAPVETVEEIIAESLSAKPEYLESNLAAFRLGLESL